jgi:alkylhydroperoxidase/carboxymuconolactone decarboxylase family protein YurZ
MSQATVFPPALLETILAPLIALFLPGAAGDAVAARQAASQMLAAYHPENDDELRLAAKIVCFSIQALQALGQAATPDMPLTRILRLRSGAVSLSGASEKAQRRLETLRKTAQKGVQVQAAVARSEPAQSEPAKPERIIENAAELVEDTRRVAAAAKANGVTWTRAYGQRQQDIRIAKSLKRAEERLIALANAAASAEPSGAGQLAPNAV